MLLYFSIFETYENRIIMKAKIILSIVFLYTLPVFAGEGMWLPFLLQKLNEKEMISMGMKISAKDIYDIKNGSLKDAVVIFGSGCTGEVISDKGLVLTNHHCGYGTVQGLSSIENNYLLQGFWAKNREEEIPCPGLTVTFIVNIEDVTDKINMNTQNIADIVEKNKLIAANIESLEKETEKRTGYTIQIRSFFYGNKYYMFLMEKFEDIRLVAFPPNGIGKFGGDTDNWAWPRHTGDFGMFRIYANKDNKPAAYAKENIPFVPRKSFTINIKGIKENDFTWVYGFPGRTTEYLTSQGVKEIMEISDPIRIKLRAARLHIMEEAMQSSEKIFIQYASKQSGIANYYKKWKGEILGLQINDAVNKKINEEKLWKTWVNSDKKRQIQYGYLLDSIKNIYIENATLVKWYEYINEGIMASEMIAKANVLDKLLQRVDTLQDSILKKMPAELTGFYKNLDMNTDKKITTQLFDICKNDLNIQQFTSNDHIERTYQESFLNSIESYTMLCNVTERADIKTLIKKDLAYITFKYFDSIQNSKLVMMRKNAIKLNALYAKYIQSLMEYKKDKPMYPDANSTLRVSYGKVQGVSPQDGLSYKFYTTLDGAIQKHDTSKEEFTLPEKLLQLHKSKDYGRYEIIDNGKKTVPLAFLASNHTTGGNSGSPVLNAYGHLIGTNFDRIWEGTMSDIMYDINLCRNITLDIRYTLFIVEKYGNCKWLIDEMKIVE